MSTDLTDPQALAPRRSPDSLRESAKRHLWRHFSEMKAAEEAPLPIFVRGEGSYLEDIEGRRYLDGISNLFCVNLGYSHGAEIGEAAATQLGDLGYQANWLSTNVPAIELAEKLAELAPEGLEHVFFTTGGGESTEAALKLARQYYVMRGEHRWKVIARDEAYHGMSLGALSVVGMKDLRREFEPLMPAAGYVRNTCRFHRPADETEEQFTAMLLDELEQRILTEDPATVAMVIIEPVQNHGGGLVAPAGYHAGVREMCDRYGILLVADEVITGFGRIGAWFASERFGLEPDVITTAKGLSSAYGVIGAVIASSKIYETFNQPGVKFTHGTTFGGHPVQAAVALKNLEIMEREGIPRRVREKEGELRAALETLYEIPIVGDLRGAGYFWDIELVSDKETKAPFAGDALRMFDVAPMNRRLAEQGLICRAQPEGGRPQIFVSPPLVADTAEFEHIRKALHVTLSRLAEEL
jgi:adenosylmethionine-8-amino-7-oxononanoate aminotransferase